MSEKPRHPVFEECCLCDGPPSPGTQQVVTLASSLFGLEAPEAIAYCGIDTWLNGETVLLRDCADAFTRIRN